MQAKLERDADGEAMGRPALVRFSSTLEVVTHQEKKVDYAKYQFHGFSLSLLELTTV